MTTMKNKMIILGALLLAMTVSSCHKDADVMMNYAYNDNLAFQEAWDSYAGKFRVFWNAMNQYYTLWDYEEQHGLDWDAVYEKYLPRFQALDQPGIEVSDKMLKELMKEVVSPLHDGHMYVTFMNHQTQNNVLVSPSSIRSANREEMKEIEEFQPTMAGYASNGMLKRFMRYDASLVGQLYSLLSTPGRGRQWAKARIQELSEKGSLTESELIVYDGLKKLDGELEQLLKESINKGWINALNEIVQKYSYLNVPFLEPIDSRFMDVGMKLEFAQTNDDIVYLQISDFSLTPYLEDDVFQEELGGNSRNLEIRQNVTRVWQAWFDAIQDLHKSGQLKGVIIDVRSNGGGYMNDAHYVLGALLPSGGLQYGWSRYKRGVGRYDFSPLMPKYMYTMDEPHEIINDCPVVVLANVQSVSMSEMTSLGCKQMQNGTVIGRRTHGGLCGLVGNNRNSDNYSGHIGVEGITPVYVYLPTECIFDFNKQPLEGVGVTPDIEVAYDPVLFKNTKQDSQIDRALQFIRTGN